VWSLWEGRVNKLKQDPVEVVQQRFTEKVSLAFARIENHYFINRAFFPREGYLLEKEQIDKIRHIPTVIIQGRYDMVCPMISAYELHKAFPEAKFITTTTGHVSVEPEILHNLICATENFKGTISA
jgi:proline iminopeptidase